MKKILIQSLFFLSVALVVFSCKKSDDDHGAGWTDDDKASYQQVINVQDEIGNQLDDWLQSMDSLDAINQAYQAFTSNENVSSATINSQGIAVQYKNGIRGGLLIYTEDDDFEDKLSLPDISANNPEGHLKSLVNPRKMILLNPHYFERNYLTDQIVQKTNLNLSRVGMALNPFYKNEEATVDRFTELSGYGIIHIYSHGWAWPSKHNITEVYLMTGEEANVNTSKKYWSDLTDGNIPVVKVSSSSNKYFLSPQFIMDNNDFSNDTIMFYGGFCYSFLGNWPDLVHSFADGAYLGFDWRVKTFNNANWSVNSIALMSDTTKNQPMTLQGWFDDPGVAKSYWDNGDSRTTWIHYTGDGNLKLWDDVSVRLIPLSPDGAPVSVPGEAGTAYPFRCEVSSNSSDIEYIWDIGDGSSPVSASNEVNITWSEEGNYELSVTAKNNNSGVVIGTAKLNVTIGESGEDVTEFVTSCLKAGCTFKAGIQYSPSGDNLWDGLSVNSVPLDWSGLSFTGTYEETDMGMEIKYTVSGSLSSDGQKVSFYAREEIEEPYLNAKRDFSITVSDYPLSIISEGDDYIDPYAAYGSPYTGNIDVQQFVSNFEGYYISNGITYTVTGVEWDNVTMLCMMFVKERNSRSRTSGLSAVQDLESASK
jgi:hypothetical protein